MKFNGLTDREVEESRKKHGSNAIPDSEPTTFWQEFKETFGAVSYTHLVYKRQPVHNRTCRHPR